MARQSGTRVEESKKTMKAADSTSLTREQLVEFYRLMYLSRRTDDREIVNASFPSPVSTLNSNDVVLLIVTESFPVPVPISTPCTVVSRLIAITSLPSFWS